MLVTLENVLPIYTDPLFWLSLCSGQAWRSPKNLVTSIFFRKNFSSILSLFLSKLLLFAKQYKVLLRCFLKDLLTFEWINIIRLLTFEWINVRLLPERRFFLSKQCLFFLLMWKLFPWNLIKVKISRIKILSY